jgi:hypothetical protein
MSKKTDSWDLNFNGFGIHYCALFTIQALVSWIMGLSRSMKHEAQIPIKISDSNHPISSKKRTENPSTKHEDY